MAVCIVFHPTAPCVKACRQCGLGCRNRFVYLLWVLRDTGHPSVGRTQGGYIRKRRQWGVEEGTSPA